MSQHFLLSVKARTLSLASVARMSEEEEARAMFGSIRWTATNGEPVCPRCGCVACYEDASRPIFKCKGCGHQFSVTSGTIFSSRKLPMRDYLMAIAILGLEMKQAGPDAPAYEAHGARVVGIKPARFHHRGPGRQRPELRHACLGSPRQWLSLKPCSGFLAIGRACWR
jgi:transposase-like protein